MGVGVASCIKSATPKMDSRARGPAELLVPSRISADRSLQWVTAYSEVPWVKCQSPLLAPLGRADRDRKGLTIGLQRTRLPRARTDASDAF